ncbi:toll/interleukin-1 receptor domain-containing protein [Flavobacterium sp. J372]|uniref:toll/interleukin-1 receptor domain-containing protein n=1 Tax=Flavobacterium sp. J372 TaxID=2898436 RepID=UPI002151C088|nr:toll/interleukin-1 receptor domain-containing protein [Flavobacterium sp. J372]MCR5862747.1 toll/interleukin-1 receptor domain-containing protein [Flavobacterium sp. J372]
MSRCTAPVNGHRSASAQANCPACGRYSRGYSRGYNDYYNYSPYSSSSSYGSGGTSRSNQARNQKARWSSPSSTILYTPAEIRTLEPIRQNIEKRSNLPDLRDVFLCHAWDDRKDAAKELHDLLESKGVSVWFSEKDVLLGSSLLREIDKGLAKSRVGIVLVTPSFLKRVKGEGIADKELSALLARDLLVPIVHNTTFDALREVSPLLGSRSGLSTAEESMAELSAKLAELVTPENLTN